MISHRSQGLRLRLLAGRKTTESIGRRNTQHLCGRDANHDVAIDARR